MSWREDKRRLVYFKFSRAKLSSCLNSERLSAFIFIPDSNHKDGVNMD